MSHVHMKAMYSTEGRIQENGTVTLLLLKVTTILM